HERRDVARLQAGVVLVHVRIGRAGFVEHRPDVERLLVLETPQHGHRGSPATFRLHPVDRGYAADYRVDHGLGRLRGLTAAVVELRIDSLLLVSGALADAHGILPGAAEEGAQRIGHRSLLRQRLVTATHVAVHHAKQLAGDFLRVVLADEPAALGLLQLLQHAVTLAVGVRRL